MEAGLEFGHGATRAVVEVAGKGTVAEKERADGVDGE